MPIEDPLIGQQLANFRVERPLGRGGMAQVYYGWDVQLERPVAIKVIDARHRQKQEYARRFVQEARVVARWHHPHIVQIHYAGEEDGLFYFVMEYIDGQNLAQRLSAVHASGAFLPPREVMRIMRAIAGALDYAHTQGVIHRDVKPSNVMLADDGRIILTDFGLAMHVEHGTTGQVFGSPRYIAPEQAISSSGAIPQSDIYALGVILYEILTGELPFEADDPLNLAMRHVSETPPSPRSARPELSEEVEAVVMRALAKEPEQRYPSGAALVEDLTEALLTAKTPAPLAAGPQIPETEGTDVPPPPPSGGDEEKRPLPPIPAAVVVGEAEPPQPPAPPAATNSSRGCGARLALVMAAILVLALAAAWVWQQQGGGDPLAMLGLAPSPSASPPATAAPATTTPSPPPATNSATATLPPTETAVPSTTPSPTNTAVPTPETTATAITPPTETPPETATPSPTLSFTPSPTPPVIVTRPQDEMPMVRIPATTFIMGARQDDPAAEADEWPSHSVTLDGYFIDRREVTVSQYAAFLNANGGYVNACSGFTCLSTATETQYSHLVAIIGGEYTAEEGFGDYPVNNVSWYGARAYCEWVGARLPTEAEWELAARGEDGRLYPWGDAPPNQNRALFDAGFADLAPVTAYPEGTSPYGVLGMAGGVWEWAADVYDPDYYAESPAENPTGPPSRMLADRVLRGGSFLTAAEELRTTNREPGKATEFRGVRDVGFRCAVSEADY